MPNILLVNQQFPHRYTSSTEVVSAGRKSPFGGEDKILNQIKLREVPYVHIEEFVSGDYNKKFEKFRTK